MRTQVRTLLILPLIFCLSLPVPAKPHGKPAAKSVSPAQREIQEIYNQINAAAAKKDVDGVFDFNTDDYTLVDTKGQVHDASDGRQEMEDAMGVLDTVKGISLIQSFTETETDATVTVKDRMVVTAANHINGRSIKLTESDISRDYWVKTDDGWRRKRTRIISGKGILHKSVNFRSGT